MSKGSVKVQPEVNIGTLGHVDNGKSTLVQALTGIWTARHSEELKRGITIRIGYADGRFYRCPNHDPPEGYTTEEICPICGGKAELLRMVSFVDCPGHHSLMVTMLSGAALMDGALFVAAADAKFPQAQDREHLIAAEMAGIRNLIVIQNKIDLVDRDRAVENYGEIRDFLQATIYADAPIIPVSAQHKVNMDSVIYAIERYIPTPKRDPNAAPKMYILRSFDVNKPGTEAEDLVGGVVGGSIVQGIFRVGDVMEIRPGVRMEKDGKPYYRQLQTEVRSLQIGAGPVSEARPGGLVGVGTSLDPSVTKSDSLVGNIIGRGELPPVLDKLTLKVKLFERVVGTDELLKVEKIRTGEALVLNVATAVTAGVVTSARDEEVEVALKKPVCVEEDSKVAISRRVGGGWRLIGYGVTV
ncbi:MAG: translation initiation factor IF-2 subunit gamma [Candidatus Bathyarchaeia archaeon]